MNSFIILITNNTYTKHIFKINLSFITTTTTYLDHTSTYTDHMIIDRVPKMI